MRCAYSCIVVRFYHTYEYIFVGSHYSSWITFWPGIVLIAHLYFYIYSCFMNHKIVFVSFANIFEPPLDWLCFRSCYSVVRIWYKCRQASKHLASLWCAYRCIVQSCTFFFIFLQIKFNSFTKTSRITHWPAVIRMKNLIPQIYMWLSSMNTKML